MCRAFLLLALLVNFALPVFAAWPPPIPNEVTLWVRNTASVPRLEMARGGVPLPRERDLRNTSGFAVLDAQGVAVPASFRILARWNAAVDDANAPIQWLLVRFLASVPASSVASYRLRTDGSVANPLPTQSLQLTQNGGQFTINTGLASYQLGGNPARLFDRIDVGANQLVNASSFASTITGNLASGFSSIRRVQVEHSDALSAVILVDGVYGHTQIGGGAISGGRRLEFLAGSASVNVREWIDWEGALCSLGELSCNGAPNAVALERWRISLAPVLTGTRNLSLLTDNANPPVSANISAGETASLRQLRRANRNAPQEYQRLLPGLAPSSGARADAGAALLSGGNGRIGLALKQMADYEPQALRVLSDGSLVADLGDDAVWLGTRQGTSAEYRIGAWPTSIASGVALQELRLGLDHPLLAIADAQWIAASRATDEFPVGNLPAPLASFDTLLADLINRTISLRRDRGLEGLLTFGLYPRAWGNPVLSDEIDCGDNDPTPAQDWDDPYWCATWTDYHNVSSNALVQAWRHNDPSAIHAIAHPAALRSLHTQMLRCAPDDDFFHCGMFSTGYGGYRADFNSSHGYVENLIHYYWMSGDRTVLERLTQGSRTRRAYFCPGRVGLPVGPVCAADAPIVDDFAGVNDRAAVQAYQMFRFVGLAGDSSYLDDWRSNSARFLTQNFALLNQNGQLLGLTEPSGAGSTTYITGPGTYYSTQLWMASIYDFNQLYRLELDSLNTAIGIPAITPSAARHGWARTLGAAAQLAPTGNGTALGTWPNSLRFTFTGNRIGGNLSLLEPGWAPAPAPLPQDCSDSCLYDSGKAALSATLARSADDLADPGLRALALDLTQFALAAISQQPQPMNKATGIFFGRLTSAVARLGAPASAPLFADGFE